MDDDQQFCLRWNNHQSTLVAVFDTLLENGTLVDCTLAAEGKYLNAHKVVLSACSPYFESLLSRHFDKHPILILKDVKFQELKAMMDYMYRGEVNISQDQLGALLKAAESLQIKGLSDNRKGETERKPAPAPPPPKSPQPTSALPKVQGLTIEQRSRDDSREGSMSPGPRKKKRLRRKSEELDNHDASNSSESHSLPAQNIPSSLPAVSKINADVPEPVETKSEILTRHKQSDDIPQVPIIKEKIETHTELMLEPKSEYVEEMNEDSIEDLTLDDDDLSNMEQMDDQAGPSHGNAGEGSSQGFGGWHMGNQSQDEVFLAAQEAVGAHRDSQDEKKNIEKSIEESGKSVEESEKSVEESGKSIEENGKSVEEGRKGVEESGKNVEKSGKSVEESGKSVKESAKSVEGSGKSIEGSGKGVEESRRNVEESGKSVEESGSSDSISRKKEETKSANKAPIRIHSNLSIKRKAQEIPKENKKQFAEGSSNNTDENASKPEIDIIELSDDDIQEQNPQTVEPEAVAVRPKQEEIETEEIETAETSNQERENLTRKRTCPKCGRDFAGKKELKYHVQIVCGKEPQLKCPLCFEKFYKKFVLVGHLRHNHGISAAAAKKMFPKSVLKKMQLI